MTMGTKKTSFFSSSPQRPVTSDFLLHKEATPWQVSFYKEGLVENITKNK